MSIGLNILDFIILIVSIILITIVAIQSSQDDVQNAFSGEKSELFNNKKERGAEKFLTIFTGVVAVVWITLCFFSLIF